MWEIYLNMLLEAVARGFCFENSCNEKDQWTGRVTYLQYMLMYILMYICSSICFCPRGLPATKAEHCLERSEDLGLSPLDLWQFALSFLNRLPQLLATDYINEGPSQKAHSPSEVVGKRWRGERRGNKRKRKNSKRVQGSPWALCSSCCSCCCSAVEF